MPLSQRRKHKSLPGTFDALVRLMPPMAIHDDIQHANNVDMIDRLMQIASLTRGQTLYLETLLELMQAYEARRHAIDTSKVSGVAMLRHVCEESRMSASDLARLLDVHASLGSKILKGERSLTWAHAKRLARHFRVQPELFMD